MYDMMNSMVSADIETNNLKPFKEYIESSDSEISQYISALQDVYKRQNLYFVGSSYWLWTPRM